MATHVGRANLQACSGRFCNARQEPGRLWRWKVKWYHCRCRRGLHLPLMTATWRRMAQQSDAGRWSAWMCSHFPPCRAAANRSLASAKLAGVEASNSVQRVDAPRKLLNARRVHRSHHCLARATCMKSWVVSPALLQQMPLNTGTSHACKQPYHLAVMGFLFSRLLIPA